MWVLYLIGGFYTLMGLVWVFDRINKIPTDLAEKKRLESQLDYFAKKIDERDIALHREREHFEAAKVEWKTAVEKIGEEKALGFPWLATALSEYHKLNDLKLARELEQKDRPAPRAAEELRVMAAEKADLRRENKILRELHRYYEHIFPWLIEFKGKDLDELIRQVNQPGGELDADADPAAQWLSDAERDSDKLTRPEKFQRALDRYWNSQKSPWHIGRDYERYIGYIHEQKGFKVEYHGIEYGFEDLGRDLICTNGKETRVIQCKCWSAHRTLHEKHVCQIFGTAAAYKSQRAAQVELFGPASIAPVSSWLYLSCAASPTAKEFAQVLGVNIVENFPFGPYPVIKCNVSLRDGTKIYHLPFDQQYDRTIVDCKDERYVQTVAEAEALGFRRAYRWRGSRQE